MLSAMEIAEAKKALKQAAAALLVKKEQTQAEVKALEARATELADGEARASAAGDADLLSDVRSARADVEQRLRLQSELLASLEKDLADSLAELRNLDGLVGQSERARLVGTVGRLTDNDPFAPSAEDRALANARDGILEMEARAEVHAEMAAEAQRDSDVEQRLAALDQQDKDAAARAELAALKAARKGQGSAPAASEPAADTPSSEPAPPKKPKRTL